MSDNVVSKETQELEGIGSIIKRSPSLPNKTSVPGKANSWGMVMT
ncbi:MAG: hypothetical protein VKJ25_15635 [Okeania sp.]|nr:hypothetical protein [Okeania sp.]MEB3342178.1 hypothetical protein [Okeania sp.]